MRRLLRTWLYGLGTWLVLWVSDWFRRTEQT